MIMTLMSDKSLPGGLVRLSALLHFAEHTWLQKFSQLLVPSFLTSYRHCPHLHTALIPSIHWTPLVRLRQ